MSTNSGAVHDAGGFCIYSNGFTALLVVCAVAEAIASGMAKAAV